MKKLILAILMFSSVSRASYDVSIVDSRTDKDKVVIILELDHITHTLIVKKSELESRQDDIAKWAETLQDSAEARTADSN